MRELIPSTNICLNSGKSSPLINANLYNSLAEGYFESKELEKAKKAI